jgi:hypothetical protein
MNEVAWRQVLRIQEFGQTLARVYCGGVYEKAGKDYVIGGWAVNEKIVSRVVVGEASMLQVLAAWGR